MRQTNGQEQGGERRQQRKTNGKKRGGERLAPRFANAVAAHTEENGGAVGEEEGLERRADAVEHVRELLLTPTTRCFVVKSFSDANLHKSLKYGIWTSTYAHNAALDQAFNSDLAAVRPILLFFSVCNTKHFSGIARMTSRVRSGVRFELWEKPKYEGIFHIEWLLVKDVPNYVLTDIKMSNTPTKRSITSCRDCEEVMFEEVGPTRSASS
jgi:hypothetical protein